MNRRQFAQIAVVAMTLSLTATVHAAEKVKKGEGAHAAGKVSKLDTAAKTFVITSKKKGDTTVSFDDKTSFKKPGVGENAAAIDAKVDDLKEGGRVSVIGKLDAGKLVASSVTLGGHKKKAPKN